MYDFFILDYHHTTPDAWIIQDADGGIRVWDTASLCCEETFFGKENDIVYEKTEDGYMKVEV